MKKPTENIDALFAAARNAEVKISLEQVHENLTKNASEAARTQWTKLILGITSAVLVLLSLAIWLNLDASPAPTTAMHTAPKLSEQPSHVPTINNHKTETKPQPSFIHSQPKTDNKTTKNTNAKIIEEITFEQLDEDRIKIDAVHNIRPVEVGELSTPTALRVAVTTSVDWKPNQNVEEEAPLANLHTLDKPKLSYPKHEIHFMESVNQAEVISLRSARKGGKMHWFLDKYNQELDLLESKDVSALFAKGKFYKMETFNNQLLLVVSKNAGNKKVYHGHLIGEASLEVQTSQSLIALPRFKSNRLNMEVAENEQFLLVKTLPKYRSNSTQKQMEEQAQFKVFDKDLNLNYEVAEAAMHKAKTTVDNAGRLYVWKPSLKAFDDRFIAKNKAMQNILYRFDGSRRDSVIVEKHSFARTGNNMLTEFARSNEEGATVFNKVSQTRLTYAIDSVELQGLKLTLSPDGMPILYGYLRSMEGLQYLAFEAADLKPYQHSLLMFNKRYEEKKLAPNVYAPAELRFKTDKVFFDELGNFYVLSSSYYRNYLPLVEQQKEAHQIEYSDKIPVPYYRTWDVYVHKFNAQGMPVMNAKIENNSSQKQADSKPYSYLFKNNHCSIVHLDKAKNESYTTLEHSKTVTRETQKEALSVAAVQTNGRVIRLQVKNNVDIPMDAYQPIQYFHNDRETLVLLKDSKNAYTIGRLYYDEN